uniref:HERV-K_8p23.1 provirus ancestral Gag polyprotein n=1 Tax=Anthurium amnicola TaxID=1678845 RepID=A0A1D1ZCC8_9ARAE
MEYDHAPPAPSQKPSPPPNCLPCCFRRGDGGAPPHSPAGEGCPPPPCHRTRGHERLEPRRRHRRPAGGFRYDPLSYALNFDEGPGSDGDGESPLVESRYRSFSARLPSTPPHEPSPPPGVKDVVCI